jgi:membrane fusion protein (multidrug efflux system)
VTSRCLTWLTLDDAMARAYASRPDYQGAQAQVRAAELARQAASAENYPSVSIDVNYGSIAQASLREVEANDLKAQDDVERFRPLASKDEIPRQQFTQAAMHYAETGPEQISVQRSRTAAAYAQVQQSTAALQQAQLNLQYTTIVAPVSGIVGQRSVQPGQYLSAGQELMSIVPFPSRSCSTRGRIGSTC